MLKVSVFILACVVATALGQGKPTNNRVCQDVINCARYDHTSCSGKYKSWAIDNCDEYCGYCGIVCEDRISNCAQYGKDMCGNFKGWATYNCPYYCDMCYTQKPDVFISGKYTCEDNKNVTCSVYPGEICAKSEYKTWVYENCPKYCGTCGCKDEVANCVEYGEDVCHTYRIWSIVNCPRFCSTCNLKTPAMIALVNLVPGPKQPRQPVIKPVLKNECQDISSECRHYETDKSVCFNYPKWAAEKCPRTCGHCSCEDKMDCSRLTKAECGEPYLEWALDNCPKTCNLCDVKREQKDKATNPGKCTDLSWWNCATKNGDWCDKNPRVAAAVCGKNCNYCDCEDTNKFCAQIGSAACNIDSLKTQCKKYCGICRDVPKTGVNKPVPPSMMGGGATKPVTAGPLPTKPMKTTPPPTPAPTKPSAAPTKPSPNTPAPSKPKPTPGLTLPSTQGIMVTGTWDAPTTNTSSPPACVDVNADCATAMQNGMCAILGDQAKAICAKFCGMCDVCEYNGGRAQNEKWTDNCQKRCECLGKGVGEVRCHPRCPTWNLPSACSQVKDTGCCPKIMCPVGYTVVYPKDPWA